VEQVPPESPVRLTATVQGYVQGVGFRWSTMSLARTLNLVGVAENLPNGDVLVIAEGPEAACQKVLDWLHGAGPRTVRRPGRVEFVDARWGPAVGGFRSFTCR
jgi:acylphosphatase